MKKTNQQILADILKEEGGESTQVAEITEATTAVANMIADEVNQKVYRNQLNAYYTLLPYIAGWSAPDPADTTKMIKASVPTDSITLNAITWANEYVNKLDDNDFLAIEKASNGKEIRHAPFRHTSKEISIAALDHAERLADRFESVTGNHDNLRAFIKKQIAEKRALLKIVRSDNNVTETQVATGPSGAPHSVLPQTPAAQDSYSFPGHAPAPTKDTGVSSPLGEIKSPQDPYSFPSGAPAPSYKPYKEFEGETPANMDDMAFPKAAMTQPWDRPDQFWGPSQEQNKQQMYADDGHMAAVEENSQLAGLYHSRHMAMGGVDRLKKHVEAFRAVRASYKDMAQCANHDDKQKKYGKDLFAYSYGQIKRGLNRALQPMRKHAQDPDVAKFKEVQAMASDVLGESTKSLLARDEELTAVTALFLAGVRMEEHILSVMATENKKEKPTEKAEDVEANDKKNSPPPAKDGGEKDDDKPKDDKKVTSAVVAGSGGEEMTEADIDDGVELAFKLLDETASVDVVKKTIKHFAKLGDAGRKSFVATNSILAGEEETEQGASATVPPPTVASRPSNQVSAQVANQNLVKTGQQEVAGAPDPRTVKTHNNGMAHGTLLGIFAGANNQSPLNAGLKFS